MKKLLSVALICASTSVVSAETGGIDYSLVKVAADTMQGELSRSVCILTRTKDTKGNEEIRDKAFDTMMEQMKIIRNSGSDPMRFIEVYSSLLKKKEFETCDDFRDYVFYNILGNKK